MLFALSVYRALVAHTFCKGSIIIPSLIKRFSKPLLAFWSVRPSTSLQREKQKISTKQFQKNNIAMDRDLLSADHNTTNFIGAQDSSCSLPIETPTTW